MTVSGIFLTILWIVLIPGIIGAALFFFPGKQQEICGKSDNALTKIVYSFLQCWFWGQLILWCIFQPIAVFCILKRQDLAVVAKYYTFVVAAIVIISLVLSAAGIMTLKRKIKNISELDVTCRNAAAIANGVTDGKKTKKELIFIIFRVIFWAFLVSQIILQAVLAYREGDDSFYISEAVEAGSSEHMYYTIPYTGYTTGLDVRHSLEPFPIWIAYIAKVTGTNTTVLAHVLLPVLLLPLTYGVYALMGRKILGKNKKYLPIYMVFTELLVLFGYYSAKTPEKFFMTRIREGKATLSSLLIPGIIFCLFLILECIKENKKIDFRLWIMLFSLSMSGCLCSTLGAVLCVIPVFVVSVLIIIMYRKWKHLPGMIVSCLPCLLFAMLYMLL